MRFSMRHIRAIAAFGRAVVGHWLGFVVTGGVGALAVFVATQLGTNVPSWLWAVVVSAGVVFACYKAFADVRAERDGAFAAKAAAESALERKVELGTIRDALGRFLADGEALTQRIEETVLNRPMWQGVQGSSYFMTTEHYSPRDWEPEAREWSLAVESYIRDHLGNGYVDRFRSTAGMSPIGHARLNYERILERVLTDLSYRMARIEQFMKELPNV
jgi:hypothetical protein